MAASSSTTLQTLNFLSLHSLSSKPQFTPFLSLLSTTSITKPISITARLSNPQPRFVVKHVAVTSEFEQAEEEEAEAEEEVRYSEDLKIFVGNLPFTVDSATLAGVFEQAGNVQMVEVIYDKLTGRSRGFGFVTMSTVEEVKTAVQQLNGYELEGRAIRVNSGPPPPKSDSPYGSPRSGGGGGGGGFNNNENKLYVGNLSWGVDDQSLRALFSEQGQVVEARVIYDRESGRSKGFGFVTYSSADEVNNAIQSLDGADLDGRSIRVNVAESRPQRRQF